LGLKEIIWGGIRAQNLTTPIVLEQYPIVFLAIRFNFGIVKNLGVQPIGGRIYGKATLGEEVGLANN
jgi:hypothetical protein